MLDLVPAFSFVFAAIGVFVLEGWILIRGFVPRLNRPGRPGPSRLEKRFRWSLHILAGAGILCIAWGFLVEATWLETVSVHLRHPALSGQSPLRIALLSDLHCDTRPRNEGKLPKIISEFNPHLLVFTGDSMNDIDAMPLMKKTLQALSQAAPQALRLAVRGNYDAFGWRNLDLFEGTGFIELGWQGDAEKPSGPQVFSGPVTLPGYDGKVKTGGLAFNFWASINPIRVQMALGPEGSSGSFRIFLYHSPDLALEAAEAGADLYLCGHTHGGQIALPLYGALTTLSRHGKRFEAGLYEVARKNSPAAQTNEPSAIIQSRPMSLYVTRGVGMEGGWAPRVRFWARPEVTLLTVAGQ